MRTAQMLELPVSLDTATVASLPTQLAAAIRALIDTGVLDAGDALPSSRAWARQLGVSRGTVVAAYEQLVAEGYLSARPGSATKVNPRLASTHPSHSDSDAALRRAASASHPSNPARCRSASADQSDVTSSSSMHHDLSPDRPSTEHLVTPAWRAAWRQAAEAVPNPLPPAGSLDLRQEIVEHLRRMRGVLRSPESVVVTAGAREGLMMLMQSVLATTGAHRGGAVVGVESPGYPSLRRVVTRLGGSLLRLPVDASGLLTEHLPEPPEAMPDAVIVTPSHQYPLGGSLPADRRRQLLGWARRNDVIVIEDDYDSELRYVGQPLPALAALDDPHDGVVATLGTYSKTVAPEVAMGFLIAPDRLRDDILHLRRDLGSPVSAVTQTAFAAYLASGELRRHTARMRRVYRQRRALVLDALRDVSEITVFPMDGGLHAVIETTDAEDAVLRRCAEAGVAVSALSTYWSGADEGASRQGLVIGYGHLDDAPLSEALTALTRALERGD